MADEPDTTFDPDEIINLLIEEMGMKDEDPEKVSALKQAMEQQMYHVILSTAAMHVEPAVIDGVLKEFANEESPELLFAELIRHSPASQEAILEALNDFYDETIDAFKTLSKP